MEWQMWTTIASVVIMFVLLAGTKIRPEFILLGILTFLMGIGILDVKEAVAGMSNKGMLTVAILFIVAASVQETGAIKYITPFLKAKPKTIASGQFRLMAPVTFLSAFLNNTPVVAIFIPAVAGWAKKAKIPVSKFMIPLSYSAVLGGTCTLIGTSTNLVVNGQLMTMAKHPGLSMFEIAKVGIPCAIIMFGVIMLLSRWLLPERSSAIEQLGSPKEYTSEMVIKPGSNLINKTILEAGFTEEQGYNIIEIIREGEVIPAIEAGMTLKAEDRLVFSGGIEMIAELQKTKGMTPVLDHVFEIDTPRPDRCMIEAVVSNSCRMIGRSIVGGHFRQLYNAVVVAVARGGERVNQSIGQIILEPGDTLLLEAHPSFYTQHKNSKDFFLISQLEEVTSPRHNKAMLSIFILLAMVGLAAFEVLDMFMAASFAAAALLITRCITPTQALRSIDSQVLLVIIAAFGIGAAMEKTGAAKMIAMALVGIVEGNPWLVLSVMYAVTSLLTEMVTNNAAALILFPIAMSTANQMGVNIMPFAIAIMMGASASFATPIGYQCNMMVYGPGGYKFTDFLKIGIPMNIIMWIAASTLIPMIWPF